MRDVDFVRNTFGFGLVLSEFALDLAPGLRIVPRSDVLASWPMPKVGIGTTGTFTGPTLTNRASRALHHNIPNLKDGKVISTHDP